MARAWGDALDKQANRITEQSDRVSAGDDTPGAITELSAQSLKMASCPTARTRPPRR
jgi:hypothetical protein